MTFSPDVLIMLIVFMQLNFIINYRLVLLDLTPTIAMTRSVYLRPCLWFFLLSVITHYWTMPILTLIRRATFVALVLCFIQSGGLTTMIIRLTRCFTYSPYICHGVALDFSINYIMIQLILTHLSDL